MKKIYVLLLCICCCLCVSAADATLMTYNDRASFDSQGTIVYNYGFEDFTGQSFYLPGSPWTTHGVTYTTPRNVIVGPALNYGNTSNVLAYDHWTPLTATISPNFNMFAFDIGLLSIIENDSPLDFKITTNLGTYNYNNVIVEEAYEGFSFLGFAADYGEYFTGISINSLNLYGSGPALDNVTLGTRTAVPEPSTILLLGAGLLGAACMRRLRRT